MNNTSGATPPLAAPPCSPVFASADMCAVSGPCGHIVPLDDAWLARDRYVCPVCGLRWRVDQAQPEVYPSGFVMPGKRTVVIEKECDECDGTGEPGGQFCGGQFWKCEQCQGTGRISANVGHHLQAPEGRS